MHVHRIKMDIRRNLQKNDELEKFSRSFLTKLMKLTILPNVTPTKV